MNINRRTMLAASLGFAGAACGRAPKTAGGSGIPGPYPGRVVEVRHPSSILAGAYQPEPVGEMIERGMRDLTGAESGVEAWRSFFEPGDVVGIKLNPVGKPFVISDASVVRTIIAGLESAGVRRRDIIAYDRYRDQFLDAGFDQWLPEGVRWAAASEKYLNIQMDMDGYDRDVYRELPMVHPAYEADYSLDDPHIRRSYVAKFLTRDVNKLINLCLLKHHQSAGVTLALKNLSHGLVNNVNRSHVTSTANTCGIFIPSIVDLPVVREKLVLNILDGVKGAYHGGPGSTVEDYVWEHKTLYFATDPVAIDKVGWRAIDAKREEVKRSSIALMKPDPHSTFLNGQVEHIEVAAHMGLGVYYNDKIDLRRIDLG